MVNVFFKINFFYFLRPADKLLAILRINLWVPLSFKTHHDQNPLHLISKNNERKREKEKRFEI